MQIPSLYRFSFSIFCFFHYYSFIIFYNNSPFTKSFYMMVLQSMLLAIFIHIACPGELEAAEIIIHTTGTMFHAP